MLLQLAPLLAHVLHLLCGLLAHAWQLVTVTVRVVPYSMFCSVLAFVFVLLASGLCLQVVCASMLHVACAVCGGGGGFVHKQQGR